MSYQPPFDPNNPDAQAYGFGYGPPPRDPSEAVRWPAMCLIIVSSFWMILLVVLLVIALFTLITGIQINLQRLTPGGEASLPLQLVGIMLLAGVNSCVLYGSVSMMQRRNYGLAMTATILAMIPCLTPFYFLGIPFAIWAMVLLVRADVKYGFR